MMADTLWTPSLHPVPTVLRGFLRSKHPPHTVWTDQDQDQEKDQRPRPAHNVRPSENVEGSFGSGGKNYTNVYAKIVTLSALHRGVTS